jgi:prepilin-type N-terminal cleavage/methylation domain-containing protein
MAFHARSVSTAEVDMHARGYSLVEMVTVVGIISILLAIGTLKFRDYMQRYQAESQTRMLYSELLKVRAGALYERRTARVKLFADRLEIYSSTRDSAKGAAPVRTQVLSFPITTNAGGDPIKGYDIDFDARGVVADWCSICIENQEVPAAVDSVVVSENRVSVGKRGQGDECSAANISSR